MSSQRHMGWDAPSVFRVVSNVRRQAAPGQWETETTVMGPYATKQGARVTKQSQESQLASRSDWDVRHNGATPWIIDVHIEWTEAEWRLL